MLGSPLRPLLVAVAAGLASCVCPSAAEALVERPAFASPEDAGRSFLAAVSRDNAAAEYRCLSEALKDEYGATLDAWILGRVEVREEIGAFLLSRAHRLDFLGVRITEQGLETRWGTGERPRIALLMVQQHYFDLYDEDGAVAGELLEEPPWRYLDRDGTTLTVEISDALPKRFPGFEGTTLFALGTEWKLRGFRSLDSGG